MTSVQTKVDMVMSYMSYVGCDLDEEEFRKFSGGVFREVGKMVKAQCETVVKELNREQGGDGGPVG